MFLCHFGVFLLQFFFTFRKFGADDEFDERDYYKDCSQDQGDLGCSCVAAKVFKKKEQKRKEKEERKEIVIILVETCLCWKVCSTTKQVDPSPLINLRSIPNTFYDLGCIPKYTESIPTDPKQRCNTILQTCLC